MDGSDTPNVAAFPLRKPRAISTGSLDAAARGWASAFGVRTAGAPYRFHCTDVLAAVADERCRAVGSTAAGRLSTSPSGLPSPMNPMAVGDEIPGAPAAVPTASGLMTN